VTALLGDLMTLRLDSVVAHNLAEASHHLVFGGARGAEALDVRSARFLELGGKVKALKRDDLEVFDGGPTAEILS